MLLGFFGDFRSSNFRSLLLFLKIERSEREEKHRSQNEKNDGFRKPSEEIEDRRENEVDEEEQQVHFLEVNSKRRDEQEGDPREKRKGRPRPRLLKAESEERQRRERVGESVLDGIFENEFPYGVGQGKKHRVREDRIREEISERPAKEEEGFRIPGRSTLDFHVGNGAVLDAVGKEFDVLFDHLPLQYQALALFALERKHAAEKLFVDFGPLGFVRLEFADVLKIEELVGRNVAGSGLSAVRLPLRKVIFPEGFPKVLHLDDEIVLGKYHPFARTEPLEKDVSILEGFFFFLDEPLFDEFDLQLPHFFERGFPDDAELVEILDVLQLFERRNELFQPKDAIFPELLGKMRHEVLDLDDDLFDERVVLHDLAFHEGAGSHFVSFGGLRFSGRRLLGLRRSLAPFLVNGVHFTDLVREKPLFLFGRGRIVVDRENLVMEVVDEFYVRAEGIRRLDLPAFLPSFDEDVEIERGKGVRGTVRDLGTLADFDNGVALVMELRFGFVDSRPDEGDFDTLSVFRTYGDEICHARWSTRLKRCGIPARNGGRTVSVRRTRSRRTAFLRTAAGRKRSLDELDCRFRVLFGEIAYELNSLDELFRGNLSGIDPGVLRNFVRHGPLHVIE